MADGDGDLDLVPLLINAAGEADVRLATELGIPPRELPVLAFLRWAPPPVGARDLRRRFGLSAAAATEMLDRLERAGYVRRTPWPEDGRIVHITVDDGFAATIAGRVDPLVSGTRALWQEMTAGERDTVRRFLADVTALHRTWEPVPPGLDAQPASMAPPGPGAAPR